jgi:hypothetical protein
MIKRIIDGPYVNLAGANIKKYRKATASPVGALAANEKEEPENRFLLLFEGYFFVATRTRIRPPYWAALS